MQLVAISDLCHRGMTRNLEVFIKIILFHLALTQLGLVELVFSEIKRLLQNLR